MKSADHDESDLKAIQERALRLREAVLKAGGGSVVARRANMPIPSLNNYLGGRDLKTSALVKLAHACGVSVNWLATGEAEPGTASTLFRNEILDRAAHFWGLFVTIRSCQSWFSQMGRKPTLRDVLLWIREPYETALPLPDRPIEFQISQDS
jgi:hypothetical protein